MQKSLFLKCLTFALISAFVATLCDINHIHTNSAAYIGKRKYRSNAGSLATKEDLSLKEAAGGAFQGVMTDINAPGAVEHYRHEGDVRTNLSGGNSVGITGSLKQYSKEDVDKAIEGIK